MSFIRKIHFAIGFLISAILADLVQPGQYDYGFNVDLRLRKREGPTQSHIVTGAPPVHGTAQVRPDIRDLQKDNDKWNLYILALSWMQFTDQESPFSWYQITDRQDRFQEAAATFRMPYWDWAAVPPDGDSVLPLSVGSSPNINVSGPNGVQTISNPLFSYVFRPFNGSTFPDFPPAKYNTWRETKRAPRPVNSPNATSNNSFVAHSLDTHLPSFQQRLYNLFSNYPNYTTFSNEAWIPTDDSYNDTYDSIESLHDSIHTVGGGVYGHLAIIAYSGFDPLFWLHHTNVDRIFTMWQLLYNDTYVVPTPAIYSSHTTSPGEIEDSKTALTPFFYNETHFWTPEMARDHQVFGYTYAEVANKSRAEIVTSINNLYGTFSPVSMFMRLDGNQRHSSRQGGHSSQREPRRAKGLSWNIQTSTHPPMSAVFSGDKYREWVANIRVNKHAMGGTFSIHLFLGEVPSDPLSWPVASSLVGTLGIFSHKGKHDKAFDRKVGGTIPMTSALMYMVTAGKVLSLHAEDIEPFLKSNLELRVSLVDGTAVDAYEVGGLHVSVASSMVRAPKSEDMLSEWGKVESHFDLFA
ncbi:hypothetical protein AAE478_000812 [Parahypoxylon ruwenzoriense]